MSLGGWRGVPWRPRCAVWAYSVQTVKKSVSLPPLSVGRGVIEKLGESWGLDCNFEFR